MNETTLDDRSNSEFWSSFSSSEERLLDCQGLILNLPLTPHRYCTPKYEQEHSVASFANTVTYRYTDLQRYLSMLFWRDKMDKALIHESIDSSNRSLMMRNLRSSLVSRYRYQSRSYFILYQLLYYLLSLRTSAAFICKADFSYLRNYLCRVPVNGYYFFVFSSENEIQPNYLRVRFELLKTVYNTSNAVHSCKNSTAECSLPLKLFSNERTVLELPLNGNESLWNAEYVVVSICEPRTSIYLICILLVPLLILAFAFH